MIVKDLALTVLAFEHKTGTGKTSGKPYDFYAARVVDADGQVFQMNLDREISPKNPKDDETLLAFRNLAVKASVKFTPKSFDVSATLTDFEPV